MKNNFLITGVPRSGTSLLTKLLSEEPNTLCFSEPAWMKTIRFAGQTEAQFAQALKQQIKQIRAAVAKGQPVAMTVKQNANSLPDNYFPRTGGQANNKSTRLVDVGTLTNPRVCVKANTLFTACLSPLLKQPDFQLHAVVRNPVATIMSWRSLSIPISHGKITIGELYSAQLRAIAATDDLLEKQVKILDWFFQQYHQHQVPVIQYESLIKDPATAIGSILGSSTARITPLQSQNSSAHYDRSEQTAIVDCLQQHGVYWKKYYDA